MENIILKIRLFAIIVFCIFLVSCLKEDNLKLPFETYVPKQLNDGWELSTPSQEGIDEVELEKIYKYYHESEDLWQVRSLLVFRNNKLVAESYTKNKEDITQTVPMWSCTKQVTGILTGMAIEQGFIENINDNIQKYLPEEIGRYPDKGVITIQNLLMMESGIAFENSGFNGESNQLLRGLHDNSLEFVLGLPVLFTPGEQFYYNDGDSQILSAIIQRKTGKTTRDWAKEMLFSKINFTNYTWVIYKDGITMGAFGISSTPREMAKIGHLVLHKGYWGGEQIVNAKWLEEMTSIQVPKEKTKSWGKSFGYHWWVDENRGVVFMAGKGGQYVFIKPAKNLIMVTTADPNDEYMFEMDTALDIFDRIDRITN
jgi:CubicO group peptidase (beta-lactamase class C family)